MHMNFFITFLCFWKYRFFLKYEGNCESFRSITREARQRDNESCYKHLPKFRKVTFIFQNFEKNWKT